MKHLFSSLYALSIKLKKKSLNSNMLFSYSILDMKYNYNTKIVIYETLIHKDSVLYSIAPIATSLSKFLLT